MKGLITALMIAVVVSIAPVMQSADANDAHHTKTEVKKPKNPKKK